MSQQAGILDITFTAGADLSDKQYYIVYLSADQTVDVCGANGKAIGVLQNEPESGEAALVRVAGTTKVIASDTGIAAGDYITSDSSGQAEEYDANYEFCLGMALEACGTASDIIEMLIDRFVNVTS